MNIEDKLFDRILYESKKIISKHHSYHNQLHLEYERNKKRIPDPPPKTIQIPEYWAVDKKFNPFYVKSNARAIAKSIAAKIAAGSYQPNEPFIKSIPKASGGHRELTVYQIPDAAVSGYFYSRLLAKNRHRFSSFSYAYRNDRNVHFAIQDIAVDLSQDARVFIAEFDYSDFFGSISHEYLFNQFKQNGFLISAEDEQVIRAFLSKRERGIPQGTSISLFLANLVCWKLDKALEKAGLKFARYADDTVIWSPDYATICRSYTLLNEFSSETGVHINNGKSDGINLLSKVGSATEIASKSTFNFLGYSIGVGQVSIRDKAILKIKKQISYLLYRNLIQPLKGEKLVSLSIPSNNKDVALLTAISQIRRYMYGGLSHKDINEFLKGRRASLYFKGIMSFYPLLNNDKQLRELDGWLLSTIHRAVQLRSRMLLKHNYDRRTSFPFDVPKDRIVRLYRRRIINGKPLLEIPSFMLIYQALQKGLIDSGIERVMHPQSNDYDY